MSKLDIFTTTDPGRFRELMIYCAKDAGQTEYLFGTFNESLLPHERVLYNNLKKLYEIGLRMEARGLVWDDWAAVGHQIRLQRLAFHHLKVILRTAKKLGYREFNPDSTPILARLFTGPVHNKDGSLREEAQPHEKLRPWVRRLAPVQFGLEVVKRTPGGAPSIDVEALKLYAVSDNDVAAAIAREILAYRKATKALSTYITSKKLQSKIDEYGILHSQQLPWVPVTGRWSTKPNIQNIPAGATKGSVSLRNLIRARPGFVFVGADYAALEGRIVALLAGQADLIADFNADVDIHLANAELLFKTKLTKKAPQRQMMKTFFYAWLYGASDETIWKRAVIEFPELTMRMVSACTAFFRVRYPKVPEWWASSVAYATATGYAEEWLSGRRFKFFGTVDRNNAINFQSQSWAATMMNCAVIAIDEELKPDWFIMIQAHDELILEVPDTEENIAGAKALLFKHMQQTHTWKGNTITFTIEPKHGYDWQEAK
jgi:DNA polymerase I-like protein with 3'-5' exonuclease and polymerase domains